MRIALHQHFCTATVDWQGWVFDQFTLPPTAHLRENGAAELAAWFPRLTLCRQGETLRVTETQPLIDYILSIVDRVGLESDVLERLQNAIEAEILAQGAVPHRQNQRAVRCEGRLAC